VDQKGKEVITRFSVSDFSNQGTFYTDSNGREQIKRELNTRSDYDYDPSEEPVASNYYPVTSKIVIKDELKELEVAILNDRAQGGTSLHEGVVELMIHRVCTRDDGFGVAEILSEKQYGVGLYVRGQHYLTFGTTTSAGEGNWYIVELVPVLVELFRAVYCGVRERTGPKEVVAALGSARGCYW
jgi:lysosomal alpha-mannosidase